MEPTHHSHHLHTLLAGYVLGDLTPEEHAAVQKLLQQHPEMVAELKQLETSLAVLPLSLPRSQPSPQLGTQILRSAQRDLAHPQHQVASKATRWRRWLLVGSVAAIVISLGIETYRLRQKIAVLQQDRQTLHSQLLRTQHALAQMRQQELATARQELSRYQAAINLLREPNNRFLVLKGLGADASPTGSLVIVPNQKSALLALRQVAALPEGKVYRMWAVVDGKKVLCGDFSPNEAGNVLMELPSSQWGTTSEVIITVEPQQELAEPIGEMVIFGS